VSNVKLCERQNVVRPTEKENYNPVQNSYTALWSEYKESKSPIALLSVMRRILEYYFMQLCGYDGSDIRTKVLEKNKDKFLVEKNGKMDASNYNLAFAMLSYISANAFDFADGLHYIDEKTDIGRCKAVFKLIFETLQQGQHYRMMMGDK
jgi:wobble nucleotide-excising tRNase